MTFLARSDAIMPGFSSLGMSGDVEAWTSAAIASTSIIAGRKGRLFDGSKLLPYWLMPTVVIAAFSSSGELAASLLSLVSGDSTEGDGVTAVETPLKSMLGSARAENALELSDMAAADKVCNVSYRDQQPEVSRMAISIFL